MAKLRKGQEMFFLFSQTEIVYKKNPKLLNQFQYCEKEGVPFIVTVGESERSKGGVTLRDVKTREEVSICIIVILILFTSYDFLKEFIEYNKLVPELTKRLTV